MTYYDEDQSQYNVLLLTIVHYTKQKPNKKKRKLCTLKNKKG